MATTTASPSTQIYKKTDFERIQYEGFSYTLSPEVLKIIQGIADQVGSPEYVKTPQFEKKQPSSIHVNASSTSVTNNRQNNVKHNKQKFNIIKNSLISSDIMQREPLWFSLVSRLSTELN